VRDILQELRQLERRAGAIHDVFADASARSPSRPDGTETSKVRGVLSADGLLAEIVVAPGWQEVLAESELAAKDHRRQSTGHAVAGAPVPLSGVANGRAMWAMRRELGLCRCRT
jgi:hypothetical protein